jgi:hypothetical protein
MKFKGNFGELILVINGTSATGTYQENGQISGQYVNNTFKGKWSNKGLEGLVEFTVSGTNLDGFWKKGLEAGPMKGKWTGTLVNVESGSTEASQTILLEFEELIEEVFRSQYDTLKNNLANKITTIESIYRDIDQFLSFYFDKFPYHKFPFKALKLAYAHKVCERVLNENSEDNFDDAFHSLNDLFIELSSNYILQNEYYFPDFNGDEDDEDYSRYDLEKVKNDFQKCANEYEDIVEYTSWHISFTMFIFLQYGISMGLYDNSCESEDKFEEFKLWVQKIVGYVNFESHDIQQEIDDSWNQTLDITLRSLEILGDSQITDEDGINKSEYCIEDSQDFSAINFITENFRF